MSVIARSRGSSLISTYDVRFVICLQTRAVQGLHMIHRFKGSLVHDLRVGDERESRENESREFEFEFESPGRPGPRPSSQGPSLVMMIWPQHVVPRERERDGDVK